MKVVVNSLTDFLEEVRRAEDLYQKCVRFEVDETPLQAERVTVDIAVIASAIVIVQEEPATESEYLLEWVERCGIDNHAASDMAGTERAREFRRQLEEAVKPIGLDVRPGRVEL